jgi:hypothetical protein
MTQPPPNADNRWPGSPEDWEAEMEAAHHRLLRRPSRPAPWYNRGWVWLLVAAVILAVLVWQFSSLGAAVRATADATREQTRSIQEQTRAIQEQTQTLRDQGTWIQHQLQEIGRALTLIADRIDSLLRTVQEGLAGRWPISFPGDSPAQHPAGGSLAMQERSDPGAGTEHSRG